MAGTLTVNGSAVDALTIDRRNPNWVEVAGSVRIVGVERHLYLIGPTTGAQANDRELVADAVRHSTLPYLQFDQLTITAADPRGHDACWQISGTAGNHTSTVRLLEPCAAYHDIVDDATRNGHHDPDIKARYIADLANIDPIILGAAHDTSQTPEPHELHELAANPPELPGLYGHLLRTTWGLWDTTCTYRDTVRHIVVGGHPLTGEIDDLFAALGTDWAGDHDELIETVLAMATRHAAA